MSNSVPLHSDQAGLKKRGIQITELTLNKRFKNHPELPVNSADFVGELIKKHISDNTLISLGFLFDAYKKNDHEKIKQSFAWIAKFKRANYARNPLKTAIVAANWILCCFELEKRELKAFIEGQQTEIPTLTKHALFFGNEDLSNELRFYQKGLNGKQPFGIELNRISTVYKRILKQATENLLYSLKQGERVDNSMDAVLKNAGSAKVKLIENICTIDNFETSHNCKSTIIITLKTLRDTKTLKKIHQIENLPPDIKSIVQNLILKYKKESENTAATGTSHIKSNRQKNTPKTNIKGILSFGKKIRNSKIVKKGKKNLTESHHKKNSKKSVSIASAEIHSRSPETESKIELKDFFEEPFINSLHERDKLMLIEPLRVFESKTKKGKGTKLNEILYELLNEINHIHQPLQKFFLQSVFIEKLGIEEFNSADDLSEEQEFVWGLMRVANKENRELIAHQIVDDEEPDNDKKELFTQVKSIAETRFQTIFEKIEPRIEAIKNFLNQNQIPKEVTKNITDYVPLQTISFIKDFRVAESKSEEANHHVYFDLIRNSQSIDNKIHRAFIQLALLRLCKIGENNPFYNMNPKLIKEIKQLSVSISKLIDSIGEGRETYGFDHSALSAVKRAGEKQLKEIGGEIQKLFETFERNLLKELAEFTSLVDQITQNYISSKYKNIESLNKGLGKMQKIMTDLETGFLLRCSLTEYCQIYYRLFLKIILRFSEALPIIIKHKPILNPEILHKIDEEFIAQGESVINLFSSKYVNHTETTTKKHTLARLQELINSGIWPDYIKFARDLKDKEMVQAKS